MDKSIWMEFTYQSEGSEKLIPVSSFSLQSSKTQGPGAPIIPTYLLLHQLRKDFIEDYGDVIKKFLKNKAMSEREKP